jgi:hypothetical protein
MRSSGTRNGLIIGKNGRCGSVKRGKVHESIEIERIN